MMDLTALITLIGTTDVAVNFGKLIAVIERVEKRGCAHGYSIRISHSLEIFSRTCKDSAPGLGFVRTALRPNTTSVDTRIGQSVEAGNHPEPPNLEESTEVTTI